VVSTTPAVKATPVPRLLQLLACEVLPAAELWWRVAEPPRRAMVAQVVAAAAAVGNLLPPVPLALAAFSSSPAPVPAFATPLNCGSTCRARGLSNFRVTSSPRHSVADAAGAQQYSVPRVFAATPLVGAGEDVDTCAAASMQIELQTFPGGSQCDVTNPKVADALHGKRDESGATSPMIDWRFVEV
jgi:hypothetical protein